MTRGFTLLELLVSIAVMALVVGLSTPNFSSVSTQTQMTSLASSLQSFLYQAKSEAIFRNQDLWAHFIMPESHKQQSEWLIELTDSERQGGTVLMTFSGAPYRQIKLSPDFSANQIKFDGVRGKIKNGSIEFHAIHNTQKSLKLVTSYGASRIRICGKNGSAYGYPNCAS